MGSRKGSRKIAHLDIPDIFELSLIAPVTWISGISENLATIGIEWH
jgi:hypothetical protein